MSLPTYQTSLYQVRSQRILRDKASEVLVEYKLSATEWTIIGQIFEHKDGIRLSELAVLLGVEAPLVTNVIEQLVQKTLVEKHPHPRDKRAKLLFLTKKGQELLPLIEVLLQEKLHLLFKGATGEEITAYIKVMGIIVKNGAK